MLRLDMRWGMVLLAFGCLAAMGAVPGRKESKQKGLVLTINPKLAQFFRGQVRAMRPERSLDPVPVWPKHATPYPIKEEHD